jgi:zinc protease
LAGLLIVLLAGAALAQPLQQTLPNGLRVVVDRFPAAPVVAVRFFVHTGSVWEGKWDGCGLSHLVEHSVDHASAKFTADQMDAMRAQLGEDTDAFTDQEKTWYVYTTSSDKVDLAIEMMGDFVLAPALTTEAVEQEIHTIPHEIQMDEDEPEDVIWDLFNATLFLRHPQRLPIAGYLPSFQTLTPDDVRAYHHARYAPENVVLSVVGDIDPQAVMAHAARVLSAYPRRATLPVTLPVEPPLLTTRTAVRERPGLPRTHLILGWRSVDLFSPDMYPLDLLAEILGSGETSRLVSRLQYTDRLVDEIDAGDLTPYYDAGEFVVSATCAPEKTAPVEAAILQEVRRVRDRGVTPAEVDRARRQMKAGKVFSEQTADGRADALGQDLLLTGDAEFTEHYLQRMDTVTPAQVQAAARQYLDPEVYAVAVLRPPLVAGAPQPEGPAAAEPRSEKLVLPNGLRVIVNSQPGSGALYVLAGALGGLRLDPPDQPVRSRFLADLLVRGAAGRTRAQIAARLEDHGASLAPFTERDLLGLSGQALTADSDMIVSQLADCLRRPDFPGTEVTGERDETLAALAQQEESPYTVTDLLARALLFPHHPYRWPEEGSAEAVSSFTRADLLTAQRALLSPRQTVLVLAGDVTRAQALRLAQQYFGDWQAPGSAPAPPALDPPLASRLERTVERPQEQAILWYAWRTPPVTDPALPAWSCLFGYLSGHSGLDPLFSPLRAAGLVYDAGAFFDPGLDPGDAVVYAATDPAKTADCRQRLEAVLRAVQQQPLTAEQLSRTKDTLLTEHALALAAPSDRARLQARDELYGRGWDYYRGFADRIGKVTAADVQQVAEELPLDKCVVVETRPGGNGQPGGAGKS